MFKDAVISSCGKYRYRLTRTWDTNLPAACFIMLNPSTADHEVDDPTIRRCIGFAKAWGCGGIVVVNLFALRATDPAELAKAEDPVGPENLFHFHDALIDCLPVVAAWGACPVATTRGYDIYLWFQKENIPVMCLGTTKGGAPKHPLYLPADTKLVPFVA